MPTIPTLGNTVQEQATPSFRFAGGAGPESFGGAEAKDMAGLGQGLSHAGQGIGMVANKWAKEEEQADLNAAVAEFRGEARNALEGKDGLLLKQGRDAAGVTELVSARMARLKENYGKRFVSDRARRSWDEWSNQAVDSHVDQASRHEVIETRRFHDEAAKARQYSIVAEAVANRRELDEVMKLEDEATAIVEQRYGSMGPDVVAQQRAAMLNAMHAGIVDAFRDDGEPALAEEWVANFGDRLDPTYKAKVEGGLRQKSIDDQVLSESLRLHDSGAPIEEQLAFIDKNFAQAAIHDKLVERVVAMDTREKAQAAQRQKEAGELALKNARVAFSSKDYDYEPDNKDDLSETHIEAIDTMRKKYETNAIKGQFAIRSDDSTLAELYSIARDDRAAFNLLPLETWSALLDEKDYDELKKYQRDNGITEASWNNKVRILGEQVLIGNGILNTSNTRPYRDAYFSELKARAMSIPEGDLEAIKKAAAQIYLEKPSKWGTARSPQATASPTVPSTQPSGVPAASGSVVPGASAGRTAIDARMKAEGFSFNSAKNQYQKMVNGKLVTKNAAGR
jgi:hypothetical protein